MNTEEKMAEAMGQIASAVKAATGLGELKAEVATMTTVLRANLAEQQRLNDRFDHRMGGFDRFERDARERLACAEQATKEVPKLRDRLDGLERKVAYSVGIGTGAAVVISTIINLVMRYVGTP